MKCPYCGSEDVHVTPHTDIDVAECHTCCATWAIEHAPVPAPPHPEQVL